MALASVFTSSSAPDRRLLPSLDATCLDTPMLIGDLRDVTVQAGFTSPAEDMLVKRVDLMAELIKHPQASYLLRVRGESMRGVGIFDGDVVLVDKAPPVVRVNKSLSVSPAPSAKL